MIDSSMDGGGVGSTRLSLRPKNLKTLARGDSDSWESLRNGMVRKPTIDK